MPFIDLNDYSCKIIRKYIADLIIENEIEKTDIENLKKHFSECNECKSKLKNSMTFIKKNKFEILKLLMKS